MTSSLEGPDREAGEAEPGKARMKLALYLITTFLIAVLCMAFGSRGPEEMIVNALIVWAPPAILAFATRNKPSAAGRYLPSAAALAVMIAIMLKGTGVI